MALSNKDQQILEHIIKYCEQIAITIQRLKITQESLQKDFLLYKNYTRKFISMLKHKKGPRVSSSLFY